MIPIDLDSLVESIKFVREFVKTEPLAEFIDGSISPRVNYQLS